MTALLAGCLAVPPDAGTHPADPGLLATAIPLEPYVGRLRSIGGVVGNRKADLLFDSGGGWTILSPDLARERILVESTASARARTRAMLPLQLRLTTGVDGSELLAFVGIPAAGTTLWLLVDNGNLDDVVVAPHAARLLGLAGDAPAGTVRLPLAPGFAVDTRVRVRDLVYDGALSEAVLRRATWTLDLATGQGWVEP